MNEMPYPKQIKFLLPIFMLMSDYANVRPSLEFHKMHIYLQCITIYVTV